MTDDNVETLWSTLEPTAFARQRMDAQVHAWLEAHETSLASEWLGLFRVQPFSMAGLVAASVASLATAPPMIWLVQSLR